MTRHSVFAGLFLQNYFTSVEITGGKEWEWAAETLFQVQRPCNVLLL